MLCAGLEAQLQAAQAQLSGQQTATSSPLLSQGSQSLAERQLAVLRQQLAAAQPSVDNRAAEQRTASLLVQIEQLKAASEQV